MKKGAALRLPGAHSVDEFIRGVPELSLADRNLLCEQARLLLEGLYVHLRLKRAMHAIDPVQRLLLLQRRLTDLSALEFQAELLRIFSSLRDLHTRYQLGDPFRGCVASLGFLVEQFYSSQEDEPRYLISHVHESLQQGTFKAGVELLAWNGVPIAMAVERNADREGGSNRAARLARGLEALTLRPLRTSLPPDERFVIVEYKPLRGRREEIRIEWTVLDASATSESEGTSATHDPVGVLAAAHGIDIAGESVRRVKRRLHAAPQLRGPVPPSNPFDAVMNCGTVPTSHGDVAYLRLYSFNVTSAKAFLLEVSRRLALQKEDRLIIDIRANPGGLITAAEGLLAMLTEDEIEPVRFSLTNTPRTLELCDQAPALRVWADSIATSLETGEAYSQAFALSDPKMLTKDLAKFRGSTMVITDARCYSAADIFAAGFQDNRLGPILGTDEFTGAGGANVWSHELLRLSLPEVTEPLPGKASFRVALRRATRVGANVGVPLEDFGVAPEFQHKMTLRDVTSKNEDLLNAAAHCFSPRS
jgi:Peptidase family S41